MNWKPKKWIAALLGLLTLPLAMLYVARPIWAAIYVGAYILVALADVVFLHRFPTASNMIPLGIVLVGTYHAYQLAANYGSAMPRPWYSHWYGLVVAIALLVLAIFGIRAFTFEPFRVPSGGMIPLIPPGSYLIAAKWGYGNYRWYRRFATRTDMSAQLKRGDIVVFEYPEDRSLDYVKRLIGLPGDKVTYRNKRLSINGSDVPTRPVEDYTHTGRRVLISAQFSETLGDTEYRILNDESAPPSIPYTRPFPFRENCNYSSEGVSCTVPPGHLFVVGDNRDNSADSRVWGFVPIRNIVGRIIYIFP